MNTLISKITPTLLIIFILVFSLMGFSDALFLFIKKIAGGPIPCFIGTGCDTVARSPYSNMFGIPVALYGVAFYLLIGGCALLYLDTKKMFFARLLLPLTTLGFLMSLYFIYVQKFLIGAFCVYCIISAIVSTILFVLGIVSRYVIRTP